MLNSESGAVVYWLSVRTYNKVVMSSNPTRVTIKMALTREAMESHLIKPTSLEKTQSILSGFCYILNRVCNEAKHENEQLCMIMIIIMVVVIRLVMMTFLIGGRAQIVGFQDHIHTKILERNKYYYQETLGGS